MATVSLPQVKRKKVAVYGKASRNLNSWNASGFDPLGDDEEPVKAKAAAQRSGPMNAPYPVQKRETKQHALKPIKRRKEKQEWDVPSTDDESEEEITLPVQRSSQSTKLTTKLKYSGLVEDAEPKLAPWERKKAEPEPNPDNRRMNKYSSAAQNQLNSELSKALQPPADVPSANKGSPVKQARSAKPSEKVSSPPKTSALARLKAMRLQAAADTQSSAPEDTTKPAQVQIHVHKRSSLDAETLDTPARKKLRSESPQQHDTIDFLMDNAPTCENEPSAGVQHTDEMDIYNFPEDKAEEPRSRNLSVAKRTAPLQSGRRGKLTKFSAPRKMDSAPPRLAEMLAMDSDTTEVTSRSPSSSRHGTPQRGYGGVQSGTPEAAQSNGTMTPKQSQLWDRLLPDELAAPSPSVLAMGDLTLKSRRRAKTSAIVPRSLPKSSSDVGPRRTKLVDRLKASAPSSDDDSSEGSEEESSDIGMGEDRSGNEAAADSLNRRTSQSQSQSQSQTLSATGPKRTYAQTRTHLAEDSFEDQLMFDLPTEVPQIPAAMSRCPTVPSNNNSQQSAFDMDDSEDEGTSGRMRTIHELKAGGGNQRFMDSIGGLLEDIADHNASARSRRRSALLEIATKLAKKDFADKFLRQGYEQQLLAETSAASDDIANFALVAAFTMILAGKSAQLTEPAEHVVYSLRDGDLLSWIQCMIGDRTDIKKMAKERRNNMAKSAQNNLYGFVDKFSQQQIFVFKEGYVKLSTMTPRTLALKVCELLVSRLRQLGDRSELVAAKDTRNIMPSQTDIKGVTTGAPSYDVSLAISTLEALSTITLSLSWPTDVLQRLQALLLSPSLGQSRSQHLLFLTLRLCLNLTNENPRNCKAFAESDSVLYLLRSVNEGFAKLDATVTEEQRNLNLDLLVLSMGISINLSEHSDPAREHAATTEANILLSTLVDVFQQGQKRFLEAESVEQGVTNVAYGYLAVLLASLCQARKAKDIIASKLPGKNLNALVAAVEEFLKHHQRVDSINFDGEEGMDVLTAFTEKLKGVLERLKKVADV